MATARVRARAKKVFTQMARAWNTCPFCGVACTYEATWWCSVASDLVCGHCVKRGYQLVGGRTVGGWAPEEYDGDHEDTYPL